MAKAYQVRQVLKATEKFEEDKYTYRVTWSEKDSEYVGLCSEFPSLSWLAKTQESALKGIRKIITDAIKDMKKSGEKGT